MNLNRETSNVNRENFKVAHLLKETDNLNSNIIGNLKLNAVAFMFDPARLIRSGGDFRIGIGDTTKMSREQKPVT